jgi:hypothetical protein
MRQSVLLQFGKGQQTQAIGSGLLNQHEALHSPVERI